MGLVNTAVTSEAELEADTRALAGEIAANAPLSVSRPSARIDELTRNPRAPRPCVAGCGSWRRASPATTTPKAGAPSKKSASRSSKAAEDMSASRSIRGIIRAAVALLAAAASHSARAADAGSPACFAPSELQARPASVTQPRATAASTAPMRHFRSRALLPCPTPCAARSAG